MTAIVGELEDRHPEPSPQSIIASSSPQMTELRTAITSACPNVYHALVPPPHASSEPKVTRNFKLRCPDQATQTTRSHSKPVRETLCIGVIVLMIGLAYRSEAWAQHCMLP